MNINPWTLYWILQLDSISTLFIVLMLVASAVAIAAAIWWGINASVDTSHYNSESSKERALVRMPLCKRTTIQATAAFVTLLTLTALLPSTKTAAAIVIIPAIANNPNVQREAGELYDLAKKALADAVADKKPAVVEEKAK